jgi:hypothetical protein
VGFLAYKFALSTVLYRTVREMMIGDSEAFYDTEEKVYNDLSEWGEQHGEVNITVEEDIYTTEDSITHDILDEDGENYPI